MYSLIKTGAFALLFGIGANLTHAVDLKGLLLGHFEPDISVVTDITPAGRNTDPPTREKPVYYHYLSGGYREMGDKVAGEPQLDAEKVNALVTESLAANGYLKASPDTPEPTLVIAVWWGTLHPQISEIDVMEEANTPRILNAKEVAMMTGINKYSGNGWITGNYQKAYEGITEARYFLFVAAYDLLALRKEKKKVPLWFTRISTPSIGTNLPEIMWLLAKSGGPYFGKDNGEVEFVDPTKIRRAEVKVGDMEVIDDNAKPNPREENSAGGERRK